MAPDPWAMVAEASSVRADFVATMADQASDVGGQAPSSGGGDGVDIGVDIGSDDSLIFSPPKARKRVGRCSGATGREHRKPATSVRSPAMRGQARRPSPQLMVATRNAEHQLIARAGGSVEDRLGALEQQQRADHLYFGQIRTALINLNDHTAHFTAKFKDVQQNQDARTQMGLQVRREVYQLRDVVDTKVQAMATSITERVDAKVAGIQAQVSALQLSVNEQQVYIRSLEAQRPSEGNVTKYSFQATANDVNRVKNLVGKIEANSLFKNNGEALTKEMLVALEAMQNKLNTISIEDIYGNIQQNSSTIDVLSHSCAGFFSRINTLKQQSSHDADGPEAPPPGPEGGRRGTRWGATPPGCPPGCCGDGAAGPPALTTAPSSAS